MKANKIRNHPIPTHQQLKEELEEKMERLELDLAVNAPVDDDDLAEQAEEVVQPATLSA